MKTTSKNRKSERGTQLLELAIVLPLLLFIATLVTEGSDFIRVHQVLNNAAREGAKFSSMPENSCQAGNTCLTAIKNTAVQYAQNNHVTITTANVAVDQKAQWVVPSGATAGFYTSQVTVTYSYPIVYLKIAPGFSVPSTILLRGTSQFRNFYGS
jgi:Flp pilus assembly protein TadG